MCSLKELADRLLTGSRLFLLCRYISIYRHLQRNPDNQLYPLFEYFENWCQDENRHGDFFSAVLKARPEFLNDWQAKLWARCAQRSLLAVV